MMNPSLSLLSSIEHYKKGIEPWAIDETAANLFKRARRRTLMTGFAEVDAVCGGVEPGQVLEVWGPSGSGKTEILMQVVAQSLLPEYFAGHFLGGQERHVVILDVDGRIDLQHIVTFIHQLANDRAPGVDTGSLVQECLQHLQVATCVDGNQVILAIQSLANSRGPQPMRPGAWVLAIDSISPFHWLDKHEGDGTFKAQLAIHLKYLFTTQQVACLVTKALLWPANPGQAPKEFMGLRWGTEMRRHRLRLDFEVSSSGNVVRSALATKYGNSATGVPLKFVISQKGVDFSQP